MASTAHGLPFPVGTDRVMDGDNAIQALAEALDNGTGWVTIPYVSGYAAPGATGPLMGRRLGAMVFLRGGITGSGGNLGTVNVTTNNLPAGWWPATVILATASTQAPQSAQGRVLFNPDGTVQVITSATTPYMSVGGCYLIG